MRSLNFSSGSCFHVRAGLLGFLWHHESRFQLSLEIFELLLCRLLLLPLLLLMLPQRLFLLQYPLLLMVLFQLFLLQRLPQRLFSLQDRLFLSASASLIVAQRLVVVPALSVSTPPVVATVLVVASSKPVGAV
jgi:hypothetical protein